MAIDLCDENNLVNRNRGFLLADLEEVMVGERELSQISGWNTVFVDSQDTIDKLQILADRSKISKAHIMDHLARLIRDNNLFSRYGKKTLRELIDSSKKETLKYEPENGERDKYDNPYYDDWSEEKKKFVRETERTAVFHDWEELKKEYPMFGKRLIHDEVFAKEARMAKSMYYLRNIARDADELSVLVTHVFRCELSGLEIKVNPFPHSFCPSGKGYHIQESCITDCEHLWFKRKPDYVMPEGFQIDGALATRIGLGRPENIVLTEAFERGHREYEKGDSGEIVHDSRRSRLSNHKD